MRPPSPVVRSFLPAPLSPHSLYETSSGALSLLVWPAPDCSRTVSYRIVFILGLVRAPLPRLDWPEPEEAFVLCPLSFLPLPPLPSRSLFTSKSSFGRLPASLQIAAAELIRASWTDSVLCSHFVHLGDYQNANHLSQMPPPAL